MVRIAINGFGRIGRLVLRASLLRPGLEIVLINEPACDAGASAQLFKFDSIHGIWPGEVSGANDSLLVGERQIHYCSQTRLEALPLAELSVDLVLECSGQFRKPDQLQAYLDRGVRKVVVSAPMKGEGRNIVMGVNHHTYDPQTDHLITAASCTTNCLAPMVKVVHEALGIVHGTMTSIHNLTNTQSILDTAHSDPRRARACQLSLIPTSTGSATAIATIFPELKGKLNGLAVRVPVLNASITDCTFEVARPTTVTEVNGLFAEAASGILKGIFGYEERPLVSVDFKSDPRSGVLDAASTMVIDGTLVKLLAFYDNEMGYAHRMVDLAELVVSSLGA